VGTDSGRLTLSELTLLAEAASDATFLGSLDGRMAWISSGVTELLGWEPQELVGRPFLDLVHREDRSLVTGARDDADVGGTGRYRVRVHTKVGDYRSVDILLRTRFDDYGIAAERFGSWRSADAQVRAEAALASDVARSRAILDGMLDPWVLFAPVRDESGAIVDLLFVDANTRACEYNQLPCEQLIGARLLELLPGHRGTDVFARYMHVVETGVPLVLEDYVYPMEVFGGAERRYDVQAVRVDGDLSVTWRDVTTRFDSNQRLRTSEARLAAALESEIDPHCFVDAVRDDDGRIVDLCFREVNAAAVAYLGRSRADLQGVRFSSLGSPAFLGMIDLLAPVVDTGVPLIEDAWESPTLHGGPGRLIDLRGVKLDDGVSLIWRDVTDPVHARRALEESEERYRLLSLNATEMVALWRQGRCVWASPSALAFLGISEEQVVGLEARSLIAPEDLPRFDEAYAAAEAGQVRLERLRIIGPDGVRHWVEIHAGPYLNSTEAHRGILTSTRVIDDLVSAEAEIEHQARFDLLTGLMNRAEVLRTVSRLAAQRPRTGVRTAVLFCDIDHFKDINDAYGHAAGDEVLRTIGERLAATIRSDDYAARIGGDELLIVLNGVHDLDEAVTVAEKIRSIVAEPIAFEHGVRISATLSVGVTIVHVGESTDTLIERADNAMYEAKRSGRDQIVAVG
jgi:diguanylate cyclase (GGDEF)-like protein/PAS domain S-box-containing protein